MGELQLYSYKTLLREGVEELRDLQKDYPEDYHHIYEAEKFANKTYDSLYNRIRP